MTIISFWDLSLFWLKVRIDDKSGYLVEEETNVT